MKKTKSDCFEQNIVQNASPMPHGRHELKFSISSFDSLLLRRQLSTVMKRDPHTGSSGSYRIRSLYFDNYADKALHEKQNGFSRREKFRLRFYGANTDFIRLEKKSKINGRCFKESAPLSIEECEALLRGDYGVLAQNSAPLTAELVYKMKTQLLRAKNIVDYNRCAFEYCAGNVRVTLDSDIRCSNVVQNFFCLEAAFLPVFAGRESSPIILEVKYDAFLPEIIRSMCTLSSRQSSSFSKYAETRNNP